MKSNKTTTNIISLPNPTASNARKLTDKVTESVHPKVQLNVVIESGLTTSTPLYDDVCVQASTITAAKNRGFDEGFLLMIKTVCLSALSRLERGDIVDSTILCADIRYGLRKNKPLAGAAVPGLNKGERLNAGTVVLLLADAGELPLEPLGRNMANLQKYRVK